MALLETLSHFHDDIQLKIIPYLLEVFLRYLSYFHRKTFHDDGYNKINELSNYKGNLVSRFNKLSDTASELGFKETYLKTWNSELYNNGNFDIQFNCTQNRF